MKISVVFLQLVHIHGDYEALISFGIKDGVDPEWLQLSGYTV